MQGLALVRPAIMLAALVLPSLSMAAAPPSPPQAPAPATEIGRAPVVIDGEVLFQLRGISSFPAKRRAREIARRIEAIAQDEAVPVSELRIDEQADRSRILAGERQLTAAAPHDAVERRRALRRLDPVSERGGGDLKPRAVDRCRGDQHGAAEWQRLAHREHQDGQHLLDVVRQKMAAWRSR